MAFRERRTMDVEKPVALSKLYEVNECSGSGSSKRVRNRNKSGSEPSCVQLAKDFVTIRRMVGDMDGSDVGGSGQKGFQSTPKGCGVGELGRKNALYCSPNDSGYTSRGARSSISSFLSEHSPFGKERSRLFEVEDESESFPKPQAWVPFVLLFVVLTSAVVAIFTFGSALQRQQGDNSGYVPGGKYRAIEFAHSLRMKRESEASEGTASAAAAPADPSAPDLEGNEVSPGAAVGRVKEGAVVSGDSVDDEVFDSLEFIQELQKYAEERAKEVEDARRRELIRKIGSFGHFASSVVEPLDLDNEGQNKHPGKDKEQGPADQRQPRRRSRSLNKKSNPFRFKGEEQPISKAKIEDFRIAA